VTAAAGALVRHVTAAPSVTRKSRDIEVRTIDGMPAAVSPHAEAFAGAGFRRGSSGLRYFESIGGAGT
jgi:hypothetical protein